MSKPKIRFKGYEEDWEQRKFKNIASRESTTQTSSSEFPSVEYEDVLSEEGRLNKNIYLKKSEKMGIVFDGSQVLYGKLRPYLHNWLNPDFKGVAVGDWWVLKPIDTNKDFLYRLIQTQQFDNIANLSSGSKMPRADWNLVVGTEFMIPGSNKEQQKIGVYFSSLDHLITLHQRKCEETKKLKKYMLQKMFPQNRKRVPEIRFAGFTDDWEQRKLSKVAKYRNGKAHENSIAENGKYIVVNSKFVSTDGRVRKFSNEQIEPLYKGEIAFVLSDVPNGRAIARTFLVDKDGKYTLNQRIAGITPYENTDSYFLHILMNRNRYFLKFDDGNKQTNLSVNDVTNFEEKYPSYEEQYKIGQCFSNLDHLITLHQRKYEELQKIKKFMLQNMFI